MKTRHFWLATALILGLMLIVMFFKIPALSIGLVSENCQECSRADVVQFASEMGRLDAVSISVAFLGLGVGFFAIFTFFEIRDEAVERAQVEARRIVTDEVEAHIEAMLPAVIREEIERRGQAVAKSALPEFGAVEELGDENDSQNAR